MCVYLPHPIHLRYNVLPSSSDDFLQTPECSWEYRISARGHEVSAFSLTALTLPVSISVSSAHRGWKTYFSSYIFFFSLIYIYIRAMEPSLVCVCARAHVRVCLSVCIFESLLSKLFIIDRFYISLFSAREQTHCARM